MPPTLTEPKLPTPVVLKDALPISTALLVLSVYLTFNESSVTNSDKSTVILSLPLLRAKVSILSEKVALLITCPLVAASLLSIPSVILIKRLVKVFLYLPFASKSESWLTLIPNVVAFSPILCPKDTTYSSIEAYDLEPIATEPSPKEADIVPIAILS